MSDTNCCDRICNLIQNIEKVFSNKRNSPFYFLDHRRSQASPRDPHHCLKYSPVFSKFLRKDVSLLRVRNKIRTQVRKYQPMLSERSNVYHEFSKSIKKPTVLCPLIISGAIQPSVPVIPDRLEKLALP